MKTATLNGLAATGLALTISLLATNAQPYRQFSPDMPPGIVFAAAEPGDKDFGLDGFHLDYLYPLVREELDPIISPNAQSSHMHRVFGGSKFGAGYNYDESVSSNCTTAGISVDKSNYWEPQLYWIEKNGSFTAVPTIDRFYYFMGRVDPSIPVKPFPKGLRILAGNPFNKNPIPNRAAEFICQVRSDFLKSLGLDNFNFPRDCPFGLKTAFHFPSCWDGVHLYRSDNSHMAYPVVNPPRDGGCPYTHPHKLPTIFFESTWHISTIASAKDQPLKGRLAWANGDTTGYGYHCDFTNGWDIDVLTDVLNASGDCVALNKSIPATECTVLAKYMTKTDLANAESCPPERGVLQEPYPQMDSVSVPVLPGGATGDKPSCDPAVPGLDVSSFQVTDGDYLAPKDQQAPFTLDDSKGWHDIGCYGTTDKVGVFSPNVSYEDTGLNPGRCQASCSKNNMPFAGLQAVGSSWICVCGSEMWPVAFNVYSYCDRKCPGDSGSTCGGLSRIQAFYQNPQYIGLDQSAIYMGCLGHNSLSIPPTLVKQSTFNISRSNMTRERCLDACKEKGQTGWAAVQGKECFCGSDFTLGDNTFLPDSYCTASCPGSSKELCGSDKAVSIFNLTNYAAQESGGLQSGGLLEVTRPGAALASIAIAVALTALAA